MKNIKINSLQAALAVLAACGTHSLAATTGPLMTTTPIPLSQTDLSGELLFPEFNPSLGTLTQVELDLVTTFTTSLTVQNKSGSSSTGGAMTQVQVTVQDMDDSFTGPEIDLLSPGFSYHLGAGQSTQSGSLTTSATFSQNYSLAAILSEFTGTGNIGLSASTATLAFRANSGGSTVTSQTTDASLTGDVIYTYNLNPYTVVPEPTTWGLAFGLPALGLSALPLLRRKKP